MGLWVSFAMQKSCAAYDGWVKGGPDGQGRLSANARIVPKAAVNSRLLAYLRFVLAPALSQRRGLTFTHVKQPSEALSQ
jgi:hypothetical protein